ncbi:Hpt domain-containing protein [Hymenobacter lutimineralis]|uniref:Hpt domain-containing protein n=1 Tax=Hymenobacter lutimineralis TaxID=2606448 RepID=A0A5D6V4L5_9BACT|nr:Hpt domain-containing protein [Hymenobacter lutimineralis]TYZ09554.1 Hpt domain-containing protein [Hymenobacter lutimineralis]
MPAAYPPDALTPDWSLLEELAGSNPGFIRRILETFLQQAPAHYQAFRAAARAADFPQLAREAHRLRGQLAYFGLANLVSQLEQLEAAAKTADPRALPATEHIAHQLLLVLPLVEARCQRLP